MNIKYMEEALTLAIEANNKKEIPVGCIIVKDNCIIGSGYNCRENDNDLFGHAEIVAIKQAIENINNWRLDGCDMYVTLEPCHMCKEVIYESRISNVYYLLNNNSICKQTNVCKIVNKEMECKYKEILNGFFNEIR